MGVGGPPIILFYWNPNIYITLKPYDNPFWDFNNSGANNKNNKRNNTKTSALPKFAPCPCPCKILEEPYKNLEEDLNTQIVSYLSLLCWLYTLRSDQNINTYISGLPKFVPLVAHTSLGPIVDT